MCPSSPIGRPRSCHCGECKKCKRAAYMREWWASLTPEEKQAKTARRDPEKVREQDRRKQEKRRKEGTPEQKQRIVARAEVRKALGRGDLERQVCEADGCELLGHAHHDDYSEPLEVRWLCREHHDALHLEMDARSEEER
jgi:hypothetical protein